MNLIATLPSWAQKPLRQFAQRLPIAGTQELPFAEDRFRGTGKVTLATLKLVEFDEVPGRDQAMGEPGVVKSGRATVRFRTRAESLAATLHSQDSENGEIAFYYDSTFGQTAGLAILSTEDGLFAEGAVVWPSPTGINQGHLITGQLSTPMGSTSSKE